ncbi:glycosyltransferase family 4 protein [Pseudanabaena sp. PCC 6802]|uniref:glycosyltransferase family 4 protein n=1 Tax=Pseudanabaena sp. PCC 6802 TaxID=118173 RepID=UPI0003737C91|nr:glycosyltransferase family 4 protein [Pseudanabaena sp. PCC 6802]
MSSTKFQVLKILDDRKVGGVIKCIEAFLESGIGDDCTFSIRSVAETKSALVGSKPDLIIIHAPCNWTLLSQLYYMRQRCPVIIVDHHYSEAFEQYNVKSKTRFRIMLRACHSLANRVVSVSQAQANWMLQHRLVTPEKLKVITQTPSIQELLAIPLKEWQHPRVLAAYGRFNQQKGFDILLRAMQKLSDRMLQLRIGGYGENEVQLKQIAKDQKNVEFLGLVEDLPTFLDGCDAVVIPSRWEPWGNVCLEAKAAAKPVIVANVDGLSEQVKDCGLLVKPDDPQALTEAIANFCNMSDNTLSTWAENGRRNVKNAQQFYNQEWKNLIWSFCRG